jgi:hypothetical protein
VPENRWKTLHYSIGMSNAYEYEDLKSIRFLFYHYPSLSRKEFDFQ